MRGLFQGFTATAARDAPYAGVYVVFYEEMKEVLGAWGCPLRCGYRVLTVCGQVDYRQSWLRMHQRRGYIRYLGYLRRHWRRWPPRRQIASRWVAGDFMYAQWLGADDDARRRKCSYYPTRIRRYGVRYGRYFVYVWHASALIVGS